MERIEEDLENVDLGGEALTIRRFQALAEHYDLKDSKQSVRELYPVLRDAHGNVIDGNHRLEADPEWRSETLEHIRTPTQLALARIVANTHRRTVSVEERAEQITELATALTEHNEVPREEIVATLANLTTFSEDYVRRLLPDEFKIRAGIGGAGTHVRVGLAPTQQEDVAFIEETDRRDLRPLLKQSPVSPVANPEVVVEDEEPMTVEQYVADVLLHNPEVEPAKLVAVTAEMFGVSEDFAQNLIDNQGQRRGRKRHDSYAMRSPRILCPLCGRQNAEINKLHMILDATPPEVTLVKWLREVLT